MPGGIRHKQAHSVSAGNRRFITTVRTATGNNYDVISMPSVSGRCCIDFGNTCKQHRHLDQEDHIGASKSKAGSAGDND